MYVDKGYCLSQAKITLKPSGCHSATINKNSVRGKNKDKDRSISDIRSAYVRVFAHRNKWIVTKGR